MACRADQGELAQSDHLVTEAIPAETAISLTPTRTPAATITPTAPSSPEPTATHTPQPLAVLDWELFDPAPHTVFESLPKTEFWSSEEFAPLRVVRYQYDDEGRRVRVVP